MNKPLHLMTKGVGDLLSRLHTTYDSMVGLSAYQGHHVLCGVNPTDYSSSILADLEKFTSLYNSTSTESICSPENNLQKFLHDADTDDENCRKKDGYYWEPNERVCFEAQ